MIEEFVNSFRTLIRTDRISDDLKRALLCILLFETVVPILHDVINSIERDRTDSASRNIICRLQSLRSYFGNFKKSEIALIKKNVKLERACTKLKERLEEVAAVLSSDDFQSNSSVRYVLSFVPFLIVCSTERIESQKQRPLSQYTHTNFEFKPNSNTPEKILIECPICCIIATAADSQQQQTASQVTHDNVTFDNAASQQYDNVDPQHQPQIAHISFDEQQQPQAS